MLSTLNRLSRVVYCFAMKDLAPKLKRIFKIFGCPDECFFKGVGVQMTPIYNAG